MKKLVFAILLASATGCGVYATTPGVFVGVEAPFPPPVVVYERPRWHAPRYVERPVFVRPHVEWGRRDHGRHRGWGRHERD